MPRSLLLTAALLMLGALPAQAEGVEFSVHSVRYDSTGTGLGVAASPETLGLLRGGGGLSFFFADRPFALYDNSSGSRDLWGVVVQSTLGIQAHGVIGFEYADFSVIVPAAPVLIWGADPTFGDFPVGERDSGAFGDIVLLPKARILDINKLPVGLAVQVPVALPTGMKARYFGDAGVNVELDILAEVRFWRMKVLANVSPIHVRPKVEYGNFVRQFGMNWNVGLSISPADNVFIQAEGWGSVAYQGSVGQATAEWAASVKMRATEVVSLQFGAGSGIVGVGAPRLRAYAGVQLTSPDTKDSDLDGIPDAKDDCVDDQETFNGIDDEDGCPDEAPAEEAAPEEAPAAEMPAEEAPAEEPAEEAPAAAPAEEAAIETATDEAATDEASTDEAATEEAATDEAATDEAATEEPATEAATDEAATDEAATEEPATATEAPATEEPADEAAAPEPETPAEPDSETP